MTYKSDQPAFMRKWGIQDHARKERIDELRRITSMLDKRRALREHSERMVLMGLDPKQHPLSSQQLSSRSKNNKNRNSGTL